jgi:hypothetical protein
MICNLQTNNLKTRLCWFKSNVSEQRFAFWTTFKVTKTWIAHRSVAMLFCRVLKQKKAIAKIIEPRKNLFYSIHIPTYHMLY